MPSRILDLWSDDISTDVLTPLAILRAQISGLERRTKGLLEAEVHSVEKDTTVVHNFDLVAPALDGYRERVLVASHERDRVYPVTLMATAAAFLEKQSPTDFFGEEEEKIAMSQEEFVSLVRQVLQSSHVRSSIQSLIARSNEVNTVSTPQAKPGVDDREK